MRRVAPFVLAALLGGGLPSALPEALAASPACTPRVLVVSAFPAELGPLLAHATVTKTPVVDGRRFFVGRLQGNNVVMALTGIGLVNAKRTTRTAFRHFRCGASPGISAVVFSGVAGGDYIGDVAVARTWTLDGKTFFRVDPAMFATARAVAPTVKLARKTPAGDPACAGVDPDLVRTVSVTHPPRIELGGQGLSSDPFGGRAFPCFPGGGDVFGCSPCRAPDHQPPDVQRLVTGVVPFLDPNFFLSYFQQPSPSGHYVAQDMETAAVARAAARDGAPFIAFRAASDGKGDPLMLPGFPFQFFVYKQLAADNAAAAALAFLRAWAKK